MCQMSQDLFLRCLPHRDAVLLVSNPDNLHDSDDDSDDDADDDNDDDFLQVRTDGSLLLHHQPG